MTKKKTGFIKARDLAVSAGYNYKIEPQDTFEAYKAKVLLDHKFWRSLSKALGKDLPRTFYDGFMADNWCGGSADNYFNNSLRITHYDE